LANFRRTDRRQLTVNYSLSNTSDVTSRKHHIRLCNIHVAASLAVMCTIFKIQLISKLHSRSGKGATPLSNNLTLLASVDVFHQQLTINVPNTKTTYSTSKKD